MSDLAFDCVTCGACCFSRHPRYLVLLPEDQARVAPGALPADSLFESGGRAFVDFSCGHCTHLRLETGQALCAVYDHRPEACRAFRPGSFECQKAIRANGVMGEKVRAVPAAWSSRFLPASGGEVARTQLQRSRGRWGRSRSLR